jgi:hypothetical protein
MVQSVRTPETPVSEPTVTETEHRWLGAIGAGLLGGVAMAAAMTVFTPDALDAAIPALYGQEGALVGVTAHLAHAAVFGLLFAAVVRFGNLERFADRTVPMAGLGLAYGVALWILGSGVAMPLWLDAMNVAGAPAVFTFAVDSLWTHGVYGLVLGALYPVLERF